MQWFFWHQRSSFPHTASLQLFIFYFLYIKKIKCRHFDPSASVLIHNAGRKMSQYPNNTQIVLYEFLAIQSDVILYNPIWLPVSLYPLKHPQSTCVCTHPAWGGEANVRGVTQKILKMSDVSCPLPWFIRSGLRIEFQLRTNVHTYTLTHMIIILITAVEIKRSKKANRGGK